MKEIYVNNNDETKKVRVYNKKEPCGYSWINVKPGEKVEGLNSRQAKLLGFKLVKEKESGKENKGEYKKRLLKVKGLGPKTVEDVVKVYPNLESLKKALKDGVELPFRNDVALALKKEEF